MNFKYALNKLTVALPAIAALLALCSCGRQAAPEPPLKRAALTLELFETLRSNNHKIATKLTSRLRQVDKSSLFLAQLENLERDNICIVEAQKALDANDSKKAIDIIKKAISKHGSRQNLTTALNELVILNKIAVLTKNLENPENAIIMAKAAVELRTLARNNDSAKVFLPLVKEKISQAYRMEANEKESSIFSLRSDIEIQLNEGSQNAKILIAELAVENPKHPLVKKYIHHINNPSADPLFSNIKDK